jgi:recombination protein RecA
MGKKRVEKEVEKAEVSDLKDVLSAINKKYGEGTTILGDEVSATIPRLCSSGSLLLDMVIGGGLPSGRIIELFGMASSGKTSLSLMAIKEAQKKGYTCGFVDSENAYSREWAEKLGVDSSKLIFSQPTLGEEAFGICEALIQSNKVKLIVVDSIDSLVTQAQLEKDYGEATVGSLARLMSTSLRKLVPILAKSDCTLILLNQCRMKVGISYGDPTVVSGGLATSFYASLRLKVSRGDIIGLDKANPEGFMTKISVVKSKVSPPFKKVETALYLGNNGVYGVDRDAELFDLAVLGKLIEKAGTWFSYNSERMGQGRENAIKWLKDNPKVIEEVTSGVNKAVIGNTDILEKVDPEEAESVE